MRGLKPMREEQCYFKRSRIFYRCVDWNPKMNMVMKHSEVASFTDAWIETEKHKGKCLSEEVASFTDAWIETSVKDVIIVEGLCRIFYRCVDWNSFIIIFAYINQVASFTDAWIETRWDSVELMDVKVASFTDAWIETVASDYENEKITVASFTDAWIETYLTTNR